MSGPYLIGVDIGTSSTKGVLVTLSGEILASCRIGHEVSRPAPGRAEMDAELIWWGETVRAIRAVLEAAKIGANQVLGLGVSSIGASFVPIDGAGQPLRPGILYGVDTRALAEIDLINDVLGAEQILQKTGRYLSTQSVGAKMLWFRRNEGELWGRTARMVSPVSFVTGRLTGRYCIDYHTALACHPLFTLPRNSWDAAICEQFVEGVNRLPDILWPHEVIGGITEESAAVTGLPSGLPIVCGTSDVIAEALGAGLTEPGDTLLMYGSTFYLVQLTKGFNAAPPMWPSFYVEPNLNTVLAGTATAGALIQWFREQVLGGCDDDAFEAFLSEATQIAPGAEGLLALPYFAGERAPIFDPNATGLILGLSLRHTRTHVLRALLESIALSCRHNVEILQKGAEQPARYLATGGGAGLSLLVQLSADACGLPIAIAGNPNAAPMGAAYLAGRGAGAFDDWGVLRQQWTKPGPVLQAAPHTRRKYDELFRLYLDAYQNNRDAMHALNRSGVGRIPETRSIS